MIIENLFSKTRQLVLVGCLYLAGWGLLPSVGIAQEEGPLTDLKTEMEVQKILSLQSEVGGSILGGLDPGPDGEKLKAEMTAEFERELRRLVQESNSRKHANRAELAEIPRGHKIISAKIRDDDASSGMIQPGSLVDVLVEQRDSKETIIKRAEVYAIDSKTRPRIILLLLPHSDAEKLLEYIAADSTFHYAFAGEKNCEPSIANDRHESQSSVDNLHKVKMLRSAARQLENAAWELEDAEAYDSADSVREQANKLREQAREFKASAE